ncbi:MAG: aldo/keto reductase [Ignavibacteriales bacterium]|nr:aldo/keto reductase [Ignavibacteriales bacterium]
MENKNLNTESKVPYFILSNGNKIPAIGLGTFGSDSVDSKTIAETVRNSIKIGYRQIDCASVYGNEKEIGVELKKIIDNKIVNREDLWITSKVWNDKHNEVIESCKQSLNDLQLEYLDLYLVHWPFPNFHPPFCDVNTRNPDSKPYIHEDFMKTWQQMEKLVELGLVKNIGTSNMTIPKLKLLLRDCRIKPVCNEMELHPHFQQKELFDFCVNEKIQPIAYSPLGSPARPERDRTPDDTVDLEDPVILKIAEKYKVSAAKIAIKWAIQRGQIPIPFSVNHNQDNLEAALMNPLSDSDMAEIETIDKNCRLIKGQVFLWKENQNWEDLWDLNGEITPA